MACFDAHSICNQIAVFERLDVGLIFNLEAQIITGHYRWQQKLFQIQIKFFFGTLISILDHNSFYSRIHQQRWGWIRSHAQETCWGWWQNQSCQRQQGWKRNWSQGASHFARSHCWSSREVPRIQTHSHSRLQLRRTPRKRLRYPMPITYWFQCQHTCDCQLSSKNNEMILEIFKASISRDTFLQNWVKVVESATILWFKSVGTPCIDVNGSANIFEVKYMSN